MPNVVKSKTAWVPKKLAFSLAAILVLVASLFVRSDLSQCHESYRQDIKVGVGSNSLSAQIAKATGEQQRGLGGRACIDGNQAMLFEFNHQGYYSFWMKDMKFPIDIAWIGADKKVVHINTDVSPNTYPKTFVSGQPAQYVLELKANRAKSIGLSIGSTVNF